MDDGHARVQMDEVRRHLDDTWFAWIGGSEPDSVFYYRIHSPVILIEFDHQRPANLRHLARDPTAPSLRAHPHASSARPTATTTARTCCASTTRRTRTRTPTEAGAERGDGSQK